MRYNAFTPKAQSVLPKEMIRWSNNNISFEGCLHLWMNGFFILRFGKCYRKDSSSLSGVDFNKCIFISNMNVMMLPKWKETFVRLMRCCDKRVLLWVFSLPLFLHFNNNDQVSLSLSFCSIDWNRSISNTYQAQILFQYILSVKGKRFLECSSSSSSIVFVCRDFHIDWSNENAYCATCFRNCYEADLDRKKSTFYVYEKVRFNSPDAIFTSEAICERVLSWWYHHIFVSFHLFRFTGAKTPCVCHLPHRNCRPLIIFIRKYALTLLKPILMYHK